MCGYSTCSRTLLSLSTIVMVLTAYAKNTAILPTSTSITVPIRKDEPEVPRNLAVIIKSVQISPQFEIVIKETGGIIQPDNEDIIEEI